MASSTNYLGFSSKQPDFQAKIDIAREILLSWLGKSPRSIVIFVQVKSNFLNTVHAAGDHRIQAALECLSQTQDFTELVNSGYYTENNFHEKDEHLRPQKKALTIYILLIFIVYLA